MRIFIYELLDSIFIEPTPKPFGSLEIIVRIIELSQSEQELAGGRQGEW